MCLPEHPLGGGGAVGAPDREVVDLYQDLLFARAETVMAVLMKGEKAVAPLHAGAAALG